MRRRWLYPAVVGLLFVALTAPVGAVEPAADADWIEHYWAQEYSLPEELSFSALQRQLLAKASPDELFTGIGGAYTPYVPGGSGTPKVNDAYVWGLTRGTGDRDVWFGTVANMPCLVIAQMGGLLGGGTVGPLATDELVCEVEQGTYLSAMGLTGTVPAVLGDWRAPHMYHYTDTGLLVEVTPVDGAAGELVKDTIGLRSAVTLDGIVLLAGPSITGWQGLGGINLFAFDADDGTLLGATKLAAYDDIRSWVVVNGVAYAGVKNSAPVGGTMWGSVLKWTPLPGDVFHLEVVGLTAGQTAEVEYHEGRIFAIEWPGAAMAGGFTRTIGLWMSPLVPVGGSLGSEHQSLWTKVWDVTEYEPDPLTARTYLGGALASFDGQLYWGTMHLPMLGPLLHIMTYGLEDDPAVLAALAGAHRPISVFRGRGFGTATEKTEVLYGLDPLPAYLPDGAGGREWTLVPSGMGSPVYGLAGFGNPFNTYDWSMVVHQNQLYVGTFDWSYLGTLAPDVLYSLLGMEPPEGSLDLPIPLYGADLWRFPSGKSMALPVSLTGVGNETNYGVRTLVSAPNRLYVGTANPMNLHPLGGWELVAFDGVQPPVKGKDGNVKVPVNLTAYNPCPDGCENVPLSGQLHIVSKAVLDGGGGAHIGLHINPIRLRGVGEESGDEYLAVGALNLTATVKKLPAEFTYVNNLNLVRKGGGDNFRLQINTHVTIDAGGRITATVLNVDADCH